MIVTKSVLGNQGEFGGVVEKVGFEGCCWGGKLVGSRVFRGFLGVSSLALCLGIMIW